MPDVEDFLHLPYHFDVVWSEGDDGDCGWVAEVEELEGCIAQGRTPDELMENIGRAMLAWIDFELERGHDIPLPREEVDASGRFLVRLPRGLHQALADEARREGVSLNQFVATALAGAIGWRKVKPHAEGDRAAS